jgi:hypothetical protein
VIGGVDIIGANFERLDRFPPVPKSGHETQRDRRLSCTGSRGGDEECFCCPAHGRLIIISFSAGLAE